MNIPLAAVTSGALAVLLLGVPASKAEEGAVDPRAEKVLKAAADHLKAAGEFSFNADITVDDHLPLGPMIEYSGSLKASVKRPGGLRAVFSDNLPYSSFWYDGSTFTLLNGGLNLYARWAAPPTIDTMMDKLGKQTGVAFPLPSLFSGDPYSSWVDGADAVLYAGESMVRGRTAHHVVVQEEIDAQVWVEEGEEATLLKVVLTDKKLFGRPRFTAVFTAWDFSPGLSPGDFTFTPPDGARRIEFEKAAR